MKKLNIVAATIAFSMAGFFPSISAFAQGPAQVNACYAAATIYRTNNYNCTWASAIGGGGSGEYTCRNNSTGLTFGLSSNGYAGSPGAACSGQNLE